MDKGVETCGQRCGDLWTREWRLVDKDVETCGQGSGDLWTKMWTLVDKCEETCGQESGEFWAREWRLVEKGVWTSDKRAQTCGQKVETFEHFLAWYTDPVHSNYCNKYTDNSTVLYLSQFAHINFRTRYTDPVHIIYSNLITFSKHIETIQ